MENKLLLIQELSKLTREKKYEEITEYCDQNLKSDPNNLVLLKAKAHATYEIGHIPAFSIVLTCTEKILEQSPEDIEALILQIRTLRRLDRNDEAKNWTFKGWLDDCMGAFTNCGNTSCFTLSSSRCFF